MEKTGRLVHRWMAYKEIYLKDKKKYQFPFSEYQVHHNDGIKKNNLVENLELVPIREHEIKHKILRHEYLAIISLFIFVVTLFSWYIYLGIVSGYPYNLKDVLFMLTTVVIGGVSLYLINKKWKGWKYR